jgi:hypothetical protein
MICKNEQYLPTIGNIPAATQDGRTFVTPQQRTTIKSGKQKDSMTGTQITDLT